MQKRIQNIFLVLVLLSTAAWANPVTGNGYTLYDVINSGGQTLQQSGYTLMDSKGDGLAQQVTGSGYTFLPGLFGLFGGGTKIDNAPWGTVPLKIERVGNDVKISWDVTKAPGAQIYVLPGVGAVSGKFQKTDAAAWKLYTDAAFANQFNVANVATGVLLHNAQVGTAQGLNWPNYPEVYYFGLQAGVTPLTICADPDPLYNGKTCFAVAPAVGKVNMNAKKGFNLLSLAFKYDTGDDTLEKVFGTQLVANDNPMVADEIYYKNSANSWGMTNAFQKSDGKFYLSAAVTTPVSYTITRANGYLVNLKTKDIVITAVGAVSQVDQDLTMSTGFNAIGIVYPVGKTLDSLGLFNVANTTATVNPMTADEIYYKNDPASWGMKNAFLKTDGKWYLSANPSVAADFSFALPNGYYYSIKGVGKTINWKRTYQ